MSDPAIIVDATRSEALRLASPCAPVIAAGKFPVPEADAEAVANVFVGAQPLANLSRPVPAAQADQATLDTLVKFCEWVPALRLAPAHVVAEHEKEFHWSRVRCVLAGVGHVYHAPLADALLRLYPESPLDPTETYDEWHEAAIKARNICGWPLTFSVTPFHTVNAVLSSIDRAEGVVEQWQTVFTVLHILKHLRLSPQFGPCILYRGVATAMPDPARGNHVFATNDLPKAIKALGFQALTGTKIGNPLSLAARAMLDGLTKTQLLRRRPTAALPAQVLHGTWSTYAPDPSAMSGFIQHGLALEGVRVAANGRVQDARFAEPSYDDIVGFDWNMHPHTDEAEAQRQQFNAAMVDTYDTVAWPSQLFAANTTNLRWTSPDQDSLFDALLCAAVLRHEVQALANEKPLVAILPLTPSADDSTKQGKSAAAHALARSIVLDMPLKVASRTTSAPDQRSLADGILRRGTIYLDEWQLDQNPAAFLSKDNIQTMTTGGFANVGRVMENGEVNVALRNFLTVSAKALNVPPDIANRAFTFYLDNLTDDEFKHGERYDEAQSGRLSVRMRLASIGKAEQHALADWLIAAPVEGSRDGTRFLRHRALAARIIELKHGVPYKTALERADAAIAAMMLAHRRHTEEADHSGLLAMMESNVITKTRLSILFSDLDAKQAGLIQQMSVMISNGLKAGCSPSQILRARAEASGFGAKPLSELFRYLAGPGPYSKMSERAISLAVAKEFAACMQAPGDRYPFPDMAGLEGWGVERQENYKGAAMYKIVNFIPTHSTNQTTNQPKA